MLEVLFVDDVATVRQAVGEGLKRTGYSVVISSSGEEALKRMSTHAFDVLISDIRLPAMNGLELLQKTRAQFPNTDVILITGSGKVSDAVAAMKGGAFDYLTKPFDLNEMVVRLERISEQRALRRQLAAAKEELRRGGGLQGLVGASEAFRHLVSRIESLAHSDAPVLITGESGTGKELIAQAIHRSSARADQPFVVVNCAAFPENLLEAEMFGYEAGAFTGANKRREGRFAAAADGTLFFDEVGEMPLVAQAKLLRVLQNGVFEPLGTNQSTTVNVRVLSATHRDLRAQIASGAFREDLFYRLNVLQVAVPPLRERATDLPLLVEHFLMRFSPKGKASVGLSPEAWAALKTHSFPGNIRELEHAIHQAVVLSRGAVIRPEHLPQEVAGKSATVKEATGAQTLESAVKEFEREFIQRALQASDGKKSAAAQLLGISRKNLWEKLKAYGLDIDDDGQRRTSD